MSPDQFPMRNIEADLRELQEWRSGARRIHWRVRWIHASFGLTSFTSTSRKDALRSAAGIVGRGAKVYRVTVRPKGAKR